MNNPEEELQDITITSATFPTYSPQVNLALRALTFPTFSKPLTLFKFLLPNTLIKHNAWRFNSCKPYCFWNLISLELFHTWFQRAISVQYLVITPDRKIVLPNSFFATCCCVVAPKSHKYNRGAREHGGWLTHESSTNYHWNRVGSPGILSSHSVLSTHLCWVWSPTRRTGPQSYKTQVCMKGLRYFSASFILSALLEYNWQ